MNIIKIDKPDKQKYVSQKTVIRKSSNKTINFEKIILAADSDCDGSHITGIMLGTFMRFAENLFNEGKICRLKTPVIILKDKKEHIKEYFFTMVEFQKWEESNPNWNKTLHHKYIKGLGSWKKSELEEIIHEKGLEFFIEKFDINHTTKELMNIWLKNDKSDERKEKLRQFKIDINSI